MGDIFGQAATNPDLIDRLFGYGLPTILLACLCLGLWRIILWGKKVVVEPVISSHLTLIKTLNDHLPKQTDSLGSQTSILQAIEKKANELPAQTESLMELKIAVKEVIKRTDDHTRWSQEAVKQICQAEKPKA